MQLDRMIERPDLLDQGEFGGCGEVAFLRAWMLRDPNAMAAFATELFHTGQAEIAHSGYVVHASPELMVNDYAQTHPDMALTSAGWMLCGALADEEDDFVAKFTGTPDQESSLGTMATELATWLGATGLYSSVDHNLCAFNETTGNLLTAVIDVLTGLPLPNFSDSQTIGDALKLDPRPQADGTQADIILAINANMFMGLLASSPAIPSPVPASGLATNWSNHWIVLEDKIQVVGPDHYRLKIWTWGELYEIDVSQAVFDANYFGAIRAHGVGLRANKHDAQNIPPEPAGQWDVWFNARGTELRASWVAANGSVRWCTVRDATLGTPVVDAFAGVGVARPRGYESFTLGYYDRYALANVIVAGRPGDAIAPFVPDWDDRFAHAYTVSASNFYVVPHETRPNTVASAAIRPMDRTESSLFRIAFYGHARSAAPDAVPDAQSCAPVTLRLASGRTLGSLPADPVLASDGRQLVGGQVHALDGSALPVWLDAPRAPDYIARVALALHACQHALDRAPLALLAPAVEGYPPADAFAGSLLSRVFVCRNIPSDAQAGPTPIRIAPDLAGDDAIAAAAFEALFDQAARKAGVAAGDVRLDVPVRRLVRDTVLGTDTFAPLLKGFARDVSAGTGSAAGAAAYWAYLAAQCASAADPRGLSAIAATWTRGWFASPRSDEYRHFAVALAATLLPAVPADARFSFGPWQAAVGRIAASTASVLPATAATFSGTLDALACHVLAIDPAVPNVRVALSAGPAVTLQMVLVDGSDRIVDVIASDLSTLDRVVGLRGGTVRKVLLVLSNASEAAGASGPYTIRASAEMAAADVNLPRLWLTCSDPAVADVAGSHTDVIDVVNFAPAVAHVQLRNWGNAPADMVVKLYATLLHPDARPRQPLVLSGADPSALAVTVPAPAPGSTCGLLEATVGFDPAQLGLRRQAAGRHIPIEYMSFEAVAENAPGAARSDGSAEDNTACASVDTNASGVDVGGPVHVGPIAVVGVDDPRLWRVSAVFDGVDVIRNRRDLGEVVTATVVPARTEGRRAQAVSFQVDVQALAKARATPVRALPRLNGAAHAGRAVDPFEPWRKGVPASQAGTLTLSVTVRGVVAAKTTIRIPRAATRPVVPPMEGTFRKLIVELGTTRAKALIAEVEDQAEG